jgi:hypothetical protein
LKALEGEKSQLPPKQHILPELKYNIQCGNSLIGPDIYDQGVLFAEEERDRINAFDWNFVPVGAHRDAPPRGGGSRSAPTTLPCIGQATRSGGFDCVIGNPPYVRMEEFKDLKDYLKAHYSSHAERSDLYVYFVERGHGLLKDTGRFGMILSNKFLRANYGQPLRAFLNHNARVERIVDFSGLPVFPGATVRTIVLITSKKDGAKHPILYSPPAEPNRFTQVASGALSVDDAVADSAYEVAAKTLEQAVWSFAEPKAEDLLTKVRGTSVTLAQYCEGRIWMGIKSGLTDAFVIDAARRDAILSRNPRAREIIKPFLNGRNVRRYFIEYEDQNLIYTYHGVSIERYPAVEKYLEQFKDQLKMRATRQHWYELQQPQYKFAPYMDKPKIIFPDISTSPRFALDDKGCFSSNTTYFIPSADLYLLGLLNSRLGSFYFTKTCAGLEGKNEIYLRFFGQYLVGFPIRPIDFADPTDKARHDKIVALVDRMLELNKKKYSGKLAPSELDRLEREIASTDLEIDELVYELYGITYGERKTIEGT